MRVSRTLGCSLLYGETRSLRLAGAGSCACGGCRNDQGRDRGVNLWQNTKPAPSVVQRLGSRTLASDVSDRERVA